MNRSVKPIGARTLENVLTGSVGPERPCSITHQQRSSPSVLRRSVESATQSRHSDIGHRAVTLSITTPGFGEKSSALSGLPSQSLASAGGSRFWVMFGQTSAYIGECDPLR